MENEPQPLRLKVCGELNQVYSTEQRVDRLTMTIQRRFCFVSFRFTM